jgi:mannosyltransferase
MAQRRRQNSRPAVLIWAGVIVLIAFAVRVYRLDAQSIWWDEGHSIQMASAPLAQIPTLPGMDVHPPGYFALLHAWMALTGRSEFGLRYLSVLFSSLTVALLMRYGRELSGLGRPGSSATRAPRLATMLWVGGLAALSPLYVAYAQEVRMYAAVTFFALASAYFQWRAMCAGRTGAQTRRAGGSERAVAAFPTWLLVGYVLTTAASLYIHYFTIFLLAFENVAWLAWALMGGREGRRPRIVLWLGGQLGTLVLFLPQLPLALRQTAAYANPNLDAPGLGEFISRSWLSYTVGLSAAPAVARPLAWIVAAVAGLALLVGLTRARDGAGGTWSGTLAFLIGWFVIPLAAYFLVLQRRPSFEPRYMMLVTPGLLLVLAWALTEIRTTHYALRSTQYETRTTPYAARVPARALWGSVGLSLVVAVFAWGTWSYFTRVESYKDDSAGLVAWLTEETTPADLVLVDVPHPFHYYAERVPAPLHYLFVDIHTAAQVLNDEAAGRDRLFWVTWRGSDTDPRGVVPYLLDKAGQRAGEIDFRGYHVTWWRLPPDTRFSLPDDLSPRDIAFGDVVALDGVAFSDTGRADEAAWATLHFSLLKQAPADYRVSVRLRSPDGAMLPPTDRDLLNDRHFRTSAWPLNDSRLNQAINVYTLPIPAEAPGGDYCLEVVVYEASTLQALPVSGAPASSCPSPAGDRISAQLGSVVVSP